MSKMKLLYLVLVVMTEVVEATVKAVRDGNTRYTAVTGKITEGRVAHI